MPRKVWDEITYPFLNFNGCTFIVHRLIVIHDEAVGIRYLDVMLLCYGTPSWHRRKYASCLSRNVMFVLLQISHEVNNTLRPRQNGCTFPDDTLIRIFLNENVRISIKMSLKFAPKGSINNIPPLVQIMAWHRPCDKPLSEPMMGSLLTHICVTRPQWVNDVERC